MRPILFIGFRGLGGTFWSSGVDDLAEACALLGVKNQVFNHGQSFKALKFLRRHPDYQIVMVGHSKGVNTADWLAGVCGRDISLLISIDSAWPETIPDNVARVISITAAEGGRFHVKGGQVNHSMVIPDTRHTTVDDSTATRKIVMDEIAKLNTGESVPAPIEPTINWVGNTFDRKLFFDAVRESVFGGRLNQGQVDGMNRLLDTWEEYYRDWDMRELAYDLGTDALETDKNMMPIYEYGEKSYFDKYEPGTHKGKMLGNTIAGDGWLFRGAGEVMNTGRGNAAKATKRLNEVFNLGIDLVAYPEKRLDPFVSAHSLFLGNHEGWWTGQRLPNFAGYGHWDMSGARSVVNGLDRWHTVGELAGAFLGALKLSAIQKPIETPAAPVPVDPVSVPAIPNRELTKEDLQKMDAETLCAGIAVMAKVMGMIAIELQERAGPAISISEERDNSVSHNQKVNTMIGTKGFFQSNTIRGALIALFGSLLPAIAPLLGFDFSPEDGKVVLDNGAKALEIFGALMAIFGRLKASTRIKLTAN